MRLALVTTSESLPSGIGDYTQTLGRFLGERVTLLPFLPDDSGDKSWCGFEAQPIAKLTPKSAERILFQVGNERSHAFMIPALRRLGGVVTLHDWVLFDLITAAYPQLERGGWRGQLAAMRCGGMRQRAIWREALDSRKRGADSVGTGTAGAFLHGWHAVEKDGRWAAGRAGLRVLAGTERLRLGLYLPRNHHLTVTQGATEVFSLTGPSDGEQTLDLDPKAQPELALRVRGRKPVVNDLRELGVFVRSVSGHVNGAWQSLDIAAAALLPLTGPQLSDARFLLPFQRPIVRWADGFFVHSAEVGRRITLDRNAPTPIGVIPHGVQPQAIDNGARAAARQALAWTRPGPLIVSFGAIQEHKRPEPLLRAFAQILQQDPAGQDKPQLVLAGALKTESCDVEALIQELGIGDLVTITGWLEENDAVRWMEAADFCVHLRGPSSLGTSGGAARALGVGRALIISDLPEWVEFPDEAVKRVSIGEGEVSLLATAMAELCRDPMRVATMEEAAHLWAREVAAWPIVADKMVELLEHMPAHRTARRSILRSMHEASARNRAERAAAGS